MSTRVPEKLQLVEAGSIDIDWVTRIYIDAAHSGNFGYDPEDNTVLKSLRTNLRSIIKRRKMKGSNRETQTIIFEYNGIRVGFCVMAQIVGQPHASELHLMLVAAKYRNMGYGHRMLAEIIERFHPHVDLFARCYPGSVVMAALLKKHGFFLSEILDDETSLYLLTMQQHVQPTLSACVQGSVVDKLNTGHFDVGTGKE
jgi:RimJ/RimL family protein N-acetyltransferase